MSRGEAGFHDNEQIWQSGLNNGKLEPETPAAQPPKCPECNSQKIWKDGIRYSRNNNDQVQRWLCRECGFRFSQPNRSRSEHNQTIHTKPFYRNLTLPSSRQVCVSKTKAMINLATVETRPEIAQRESTTQDPATIKGLIVQFAFWLEKEGHTNSPYPKIIQRLVRRGANLLDPESIKEAIAKHQCKNGTKLLEAHAYNALTKMLNIQWSKPHYSQEDRLPFIPEERELDQLIAACKSKRMATFLQTLKETFADPGEILRLRWIDFSGNVITINDPVKGHNSGQAIISNRLAAMLINLPHTSERIYPTTDKSMYQTFVRVRKRIAHILQNPRIKAISFNTFRHWGATMTYHQTKSILLVKELLRHKSILSTMKYTRLVCFKEDDYDVATATTLEEDQQLLKVGFEYVTERNSIKLYRKPKTFAKLRDSP